MAGFVGVVVDSDHGTDAGDVERLRSFVRRGRGALGSAESVHVAAGFDGRTGEPPNHHFDRRTGWWTLFTGCLFERRTTLDRLGLEPQTIDVKAVAAWIDRYGIERLADLPGDFAVVRCRPDAASLTLAVAPLASRMLYWHRGTAGISFATRIPYLHHLPAVPRNLDTTQLAVHFAAMVGDVTRTMFQGIRQLPPGDLIHFTRNGERTVPLWRPDPHRRVRYKTDADYADAARELLDRAVARRMEAAAHPAFLMSGGLDSAAMIAAAAQVSSDRRLETYTVVPPPGAPVVDVDGWYRDETPKVRALAETFPRIASTFCSSSDPAAFERDTRILFQTNGSPSMLAGHHGWFDPAYRAIARGGHDVVLTGSLGNGTLSFDGLLGFGDLVRGGRWATAARLLPKVARYSLRRPRDIVRNSIVLPMVPNRIVERHRRRRLGRHPLTRFCLLRSEWLDAVEIDRFMEANGEQSRVGAGGLRAVSSFRDVMIHQVMRRRTLGVSNEMMLGFHYGFEFRDVFADRDLVAFCLAIPAEQYLVDGRDRSLIRRVLAGRVPGFIVDEVLVGQQMPEWASRMAGQRAVFAEELDRFAQDPGIAAMIDIDRCRAILATMPGPDDPVGMDRLAYTVSLSRAIHVGRFIRWATGGNH